MSKFFLFSAILLTSCTEVPTRSACNDFDRAKWANANVNTQTRNHMADRLVADCNMTGMTKSEVIGMLGLPATTGYFREYDLVYYLGPERGWIGIDSEWLIIKLGKNGNVTEYKIARD